MPHLKVSGFLGVFCSEYATYSAKGLIPTTAYSEALKEACKVCGYSLSDGAAAIIDLRVKSKGLKISTFAILKEDYGQMPCELYWDDYYKYPTVRGSFINQR